MLLEKNLGITNRSPLEVAGVTSATNNGGLTNERCHTRGVQDRHRSELSFWAPCFLKVEINTSLERHYVT